MTRLLRNAAAAFVIVFGWVTLFVACSARADAATTSAWTTSYKFGLSAPADSHLGMAIVGVKRELAYVGYGGGMVVDTPVFGDAARKSTKRFQTANGIYSSGEVGPTTARYLFRLRALQQERLYAIPNHLLAKLKSLESANDPNAIGPSGFDHGLYQIYLPFHPDVTLALAIDPAFSTQWAAENLVDAYRQLGDWDAAVAAHNVGIYYAGQWLLAGKPKSGLVLGSGTDIFATATLYVSLVKSRAW